MTSDESPLLRHTREELTRAGMLDSDADYDGEVGQLVLRLVEVFTSFGHSEGSAMLTLGAFNQVARYRPLSPLTDDPDEWVHVADGSVDDREPPLWQNRRRSDAFSNDGGKSYYLVSEKTEGATPTMHAAAPSLPKKQENTSD